MLCAGKIPWRNTPVHSLSLQASSKLVFSAVSFLRVSGDSRGQCNASSQPCQLLSPCVTHLPSRGCGSAFSSPSPPRSDGPAPTWALLIPCFQRAGATVLSGEKRSPLSRYNRHWKPPLKDLCNLNWNKLIVSPAWSLWQACLAPGCCIYHSAQVGSPQERWEIKTKCSNVLATPSPWRNLCLLFQCRNPAEQILLGRDDHFTTPTQFVVLLVTLRKLLKENLCVFTFLFNCV